MTAKVTGLVTPSDDNYNLLERGLGLPPAADSFDTLWT